MTKEHVRVDSLDEALADFAAGKPLVVLDSPARENEGDLIMSAELATPQWVGFFIRHTSGYLCAPITHQRADELALPQMVSRNQDSLRTDYTVSVDAAQGVTTGISATDRCRVINLLAAPDTTPTDFVRPGHVLPLRARPGGVVERPGHTEATIDLCRLTGLREAGVLAELVHDNGEMQRADDCRAFADEHGLKLITVEELREHLLTRSDQSAATPYDGVFAGPTASLPTRFGTFTSHVFVGSDGIEHIALVMGDVDGGTDVATRVHSECLTGDVFGSGRCDCGEQLHWSMQRIADQGRGVIVYLRGHEGRGIGLAAKMAAYTLQDQGFDTVDANTELGHPVDGRSYAVGAAILHRLGVASVCLHTNNPAKVDALREYGITVASLQPVVIQAGEHNAKYLQTKAQKMGHDIPESTWALS